MNFISQALNSNSYKSIDVLVTYLMLIASLIPIIAVYIRNKPLENLASASSFGTKLSLMIIFYSFIVNDWMIGSIGAFTLIAGDAGLIILSLLYKEDYK